jgi:hypothetical protein
MIDTILVKTYLSVGKDIFYHLDITHVQMSNQYIKYKYKDKQFTVKVKTLYDVPLYRILCYFYDDDMKLKMMKYILDRI